MVHGVEDCRSEYTKPLHRGCCSHKIQDAQDHECASIIMWAIVRDKDQIMTIDLQEVLPGSSGNYYHWFFTKLLHYTWCKKENWRNLICMKMGRMNSQMNWYKYICKICLYPLILVTWYLTQKQYILQQALESLTFLETWENRKKKPRDALHLHQWK